MDNFSIDAGTGDTIIVAILLPCLVVGHVPVNDVLVDCLMNLAHKQWVALHAKVNLGSRLKVAASGSCWIGHPMTSADAVQLDRCFHYAVAIDTRRMTYVLATTETVVSWYSFKYDNNLRPGDFELLERLDLRKVPQFGDKETAKRAAIALGLKTWIYVRL
uniref:Uncharacterized protein n=1 Tax=Ralstonia solanacearum TaxID=305 RepID=A0A0S4V9V7_RALSL|nr:conserved protein of unknown function [Ralstonia solanacearum]